MLPDDAIERRPSISLTDLAGDGKLAQFLGNTAKVTLFGTRMNTDVTDDSTESTLKNPIF